MKNQSEYDRMLARTLAVMSALDKAFAAEDKRDEAMRPSGDRKLSVAQQVLSKGK